MFQSFDVPTHQQGAARLALLRVRLAECGLEGFLVPRADRFQSEYVPPSDERLLWLTGFTGSAGFCVVLEDKAALFVDGRYEVQATQQVDQTAFGIVALAESRPKDWLKVHGASKTIGYDPWLHTQFEIEGLKSAGLDLVEVPCNPIDEIWENRPPAPMGAAHPHPLEFAGEGHEAKLSRMAEAVGQAGADAFVITSPDSLCWLLNIRGGDVAHNPVVLCYGVLHKDARLSLFIDADKLSPALLSELGPAVDTHPLGGIADYISGFGGRIGLAKSAPVVIWQAGADPVVMADPCLLAKACKNPTELAGARAAHLRDGVAMVRFLHWLDTALAAGEEVSEITAAEKLEHMRFATERLEDISFDTISGFGPNGALPHYRVSRESNLPLKDGSLFLIDSGGQYRDGTTDVTRTVAIGTPTPDMLRANTLVLKGMIAVSMARFPKGTPGTILDGFARAALWRSGLDFDHGTGHGVGSFLSVHEGPQSLSKRGHVPLEPGMIVSNEPGYYRQGAFGIRIENLLAVYEAEMPEGGEREMLGFETLTLVPIDLRLIDQSLLTGAEIDWLNAYHARVYEAIFPCVDSETQNWLEIATTSLSYTS